MIICENLLISLGGKMQAYKTEEVIFNEGDIPKFYYQIKKGTVKINNYHEDGKELIHSVPFDGHCFAETFLLGNKVYPVNAVALTDCEIIRLEKSKFIHLINHCPEILFKVSSHTAERMYYRYIMLNTLAIVDPSEKVRRVMECLKNYKKEHRPYSYQFPFTRKQLASLTGLCVETVIRIVKKMEKEKMVKIESGKIFY